MKDGIIAQQLVQADITSLEDLSYERKMQMCNLCYQTVYTAIVYPSYTTLDEDAVKGELNRLSTFFTEMTKVIEDTRKDVRAHSADHTTMEESLVSIRLIGLPTSVWQVMLSTFDPGMSKHAPSAVP